MNRYIFKTSKSLSKVLQETYNKNKQQGITEEDFLVISKLFKNLPVAKLKVIAIRLGYHQ